MKFRDKIIWTFIVAFVLFFATSDYFARQVIFNSFEKIESDAAMSDMGRILYFINDSFTSFDEIVRDYATWDDTYKFIKDHNKAYMKSNLLSQTFDNINVQSIILADENGQVVYSQSYDTAACKVCPLPTAEEQSILQGFNDRGLTADKHGLLLLPSGIMQVDARPILKSDASGPSRGVLIMGRYFDVRELNRLIAITHIFTTAYPLNQPLPDEIKGLLPALEKEHIVLDGRHEKNKIFGYLLVRNIFHQPILVLRAEVPNDLRFQSQIFYSLLSLNRLGAFIFAALIALVILQLIVVVPIAHVNRKLKSVIDKCASIKDKSLPPAVDEMADLEGITKKILNELECQRPPENPSGK